MTQLRPDISWVWSIKGEVITVLQSESILFRSHQIADRTRQINHRSCSAFLSNLLFNTKQKCQVFKGKVLACPLGYWYLLMFINVTYLTRTGAQSSAARNLEILREPELIIKPHLSRGPDHWSGGEREKISDRAGGGLDPERDFRQF